MGDVNKVSFGGMLGKRTRPGTSPNPEQDTIAMEGPTAPIKRARIPRGGMRGAALLKAAGVTSTKEYHKKNNEYTPRVPSSCKEKRPSAPRSATRRNRTTLEIPPAGHPLLRQTLPAKLQALKDIFLAIQTVYEMLRRRNRRTTFANMKDAVEEAGGRRFEESHLHQLHTLCPDCFGLENINLPLSPRSTRSTKQTLLTILPEAATLEATAFRGLVHSRLAQHLLDAYAAHLRSAAREKHAAGDPIKAAELEKAAQQKAPITNFLAPFPEDVPDIGALQGPLSSESAGARTNISSPRPVSSSARVTFSGSPTLSKAIEDKEQKQQKQGTINQRHRRLSFINSNSLIKDHHLTNEVTMNEDTDALLASLPPELRRRSVDGIISVDTLRVLEGNEAIHRRLSTEEARAGRIASAAHGALPQTFAKIKRIFGPRGPSAMKLHDIVSKLRQGGGELTEDKEVIAQIQCLAEHAPEFVQLKPWSSCGTPAVWINRKCDGNALAQRLKSIAAQRFVHTNE